MPRDDLYLLELVQAAREIEVYLSGVDEKRWAADSMLRSAVLHQLTIMGEVARAVSPDVRGRHPHVPWARMRAFRNIAVHQYFAVEWRAVLAIARDDVPVVEKQALDVLRAEAPDAADRLESE